MGNSLFHSTTTSTEIKYRDDVYDLSQENNLTGESDECAEKISDCEPVPMWPDTLCETTPRLGYGCFSDWFDPASKFVFIFLAEMLACLVYSFIVAGASYRFPGSFVVTILIRTTIIGCSRYFIVLMWSRLTGGFLDLWLMLLVGFCEMFFLDGNRKSVGSEATYRFSVFGKMITFFFAQLLGYFVGIALWSAVVGYAVTTHCGTGFAPACVIRPSLVGVGLSQGRFAEFVGYLLIYMAYFVGWSFHKKKTMIVMPCVQSGVNARSDSDICMDDASKPASVRRTIPFEINDSWAEVAKAVAAVSVAAHLLFGATNGSSLNFWFWMVTGAYSHDFGQSDVYAWPGMAAGLVVFVMHLIYYLLVKCSVPKRKNSYKNY